jgi:hypothetical protein
MTVETKLGIEWEVAAEFEEEWPEISINCIDVIVVDHRSAPHDPWIRPASARVRAPLRAEHWCFLLCLADKHHPFLVRKALQMLGHDVVFALPRRKLHERDSTLEHKILQLRYELSRHGAH